MQEKLDQIEIDHHHLSKNKNKEIMKEGLLIFDKKHSKVHLIIETEIIIEIKKNDFNLSRLTFLYIFE